MMPGLIEFELIFLRSGKFRRGLILWLFLEGFYTESVLHGARKITNGFSNAMSKYVGGAGMRQGLSWNKS